MNSGAIRKNLFSFYLVELSRNWVEVTLISWSALPPTLFLSPFLSLSLVLPLYSRELEHYCCLQPPEQGWCSSNPSQFHWLSQQLPIKCYLLGSPKAAEKRQEQRMEGHDEGVRKSWGEEAKRGSRESQMRLFFFSLFICGWGTGCIWNFHISNEESRETGQRKTESWVCFSCWPSLIFSWLLAGRVHQTWGGCGSSWAGNEEVFWQPLYPVLTLLSHPLLINTSLHCQKPLICK